jgi:hypothetical protein
VGQQHLLKGRDERHGEEQGGGRLEACARAPVRVHPKRKLLLLPITDKPDAGDECLVLHAGQEKLGIRRPPTSSRDEMVDAQRWSWLEEWVGSQHQHHHQPPFDKDIPVAHQSPYRLGCSARRSFVRPRRTPPRAAGDPTYCYDDDSSAAFPGYMASTASAKAKFRSMSTPKERSSSDDAYSELCFPFADRLLSPIPSIASDMGFARSTRPPAAAQRSPRVALKGPMTPARTRSRRSLGHYSFGSEAALHQLQVVEHYTPVR